MKVTLQHVTKQFPGRGKGARAVTAVNDFDFTLPDGSARTLVICEKISATPAAYPRNGGKIAKSPLK